jgi:hypothetical protein
MNPIAKNHDMLMCLGLVLRLLPGSCYPGTSRNQVLVTEESASIMKPGQKRPIARNIYPVWLPGKQWNNFLWY